MRVAIVGRNLNDLRGILKQFPFDVVTDNPDVVISYGGDGALLGAERDFPGIPKCPVRDSTSNTKCSKHAEERILQMLADGDLSESRLVKLEGSTPDGPVVAGINDVVVSKQIISSAVRYRLWLNGELYINQIVGDGLIVATPFGSSGYYRSITHSTFWVGIGLAFNNSTEPLDHLVVATDTVIKIEIIRGPAVLLADNNPLRVPLSHRDVVTVKSTEHETIVLGLDLFRCQDCYLRRQQEV